MKTKLAQLLPISLVLWSAQAVADPVDVSLAPSGLIGKSLPAVSLHIQEPIAGFELKLQRSDGKALDVKGGGAPGQTRTIELTQPEGTFHYQGQLLINFPKGDTDSMPLEFDASLMGPLRIAFEDKNLDLERRKLTFTLNHPAAKAHLKVLMDTGDLAVDDDVPLHGEKPGTPLELTWPARAGHVLTINFKAYDTSEFFNGLELSPWRIDIPHEEVNFDSGKWDIRKDQQAKLDQSYRAIFDAVQKYGRLAAVNLYVAGHTDTVGANASNRTLSLNRARSIGAYLRKRGLRIPVFYEGFGEEALLFATPDETDEPRNRRAEYIIAIDKPTVAHAPFAPNWRKL